MVEDENNKVIETLYLNMYDKLYAYACSLLQNSSLAEEAIQETFVIACRKMDVLVSSESPEGWLVNTLRNVISNMKTNRANQVRILSNYCITQKESWSEDDIPISVLYSDLCQDDDFKILLEMFVEGKSQMEIANERGISISACKKRVQRMKSSVRRRIRL